MADGLVHFLASLSLAEWFLFFWPFFFFDFVRYTLLDLVLIPAFLLRRFRERGARAAARTRLYRQLPLVSVIVPGKNEGPHLEKLARSLLEQTYRNIELIVVDDGSDDQTPAIGRRLEAQGLVDLFIRNEVRGGKASAANTALRYAQGEFVVHVDADSHLKNDSIEKIILPFMMDADIGAVGGDVRVANSSASLATRAQAIEYMKSISTGRTVSALLGILRIVAGAHGAFRKDVLDRLGGWDVGPGLDGDLTVKIRKLGLKVTHEPYAVCYTNVPVTFRRLAKQRFRWDRSLIRFRLRKHRDVFRPDANFQLTNFFSFLENTFFNVLLNIRWWVYVTQILIMGHDVIEYILLTNYLLYLVVNFLQFGMSIFLYGNGLRKAELALTPYLFLMPPYMGIFLRVVRTYAYVMEALHRVSYRDQWNPWKVSSISRREDDE
ncbi:glycosyltransferase family 2 protein [Guyparkeria hydrothermalis]|uniref:glycosyltransferase family 2 protein n=1 Tax=Guyparkeria hydrothermalis TaxID=923 RepID=UPI002020364D|nr:glycosyltransferase [Guyparkeria hydrothermalis]MCL7744737.1 glycosyltransferase family 2 protein [Guyparkeria hydrothermalis]